MSAKVFKWIDPLISMSYFVFVLFCSWFIWSNAMWTFVRRPSSVNFSHLNLFLRNCLAKWTTTYGMSSIKINQFNQSNMDFFLFSKYNTQWIITLYDWYMRCSQQIVLILGLLATYMAAIGSPWFVHCLYKPGQRYRLLRASCLFYFELLHCCFCCFTLNCYIVVFAINVDLYIHHLCELSILFKYDTC